MGGFGSDQMNDKSQNTSVNRSEKTSAGEREKTVATPYFDAAAIEKAQPAVPLEEVRARNSWPTTALLITAILSGLVGGVMGGLLPGLFLKDQAATQTAASQQASADTAVAEEDTPAPAQNNNQVEETPSTNGGAPEEQTGSETAGRGAAPKETEATLREALNDWVAATNARDIDRQMMFYNPVVEAFYRSRNASREEVRRDKERVFERASSIDIRTGAPDIRLSADGRTAIMRFHKRYAITGGGEDRRGEVVQELRWQRINGEWRITSERDLRVVR
jgi:ketosteroid isomerase-like protein